MDLRLGPYPVTALPPSALAPGAAAQILVTNAAGTAWVPVTSSGVLTNTALGAWAFASGNFGALPISTTGTLAVRGATFADAGAVVRAEIDPTTGVGTFGGTGAAGGTNARGHVGPLPGFETSNAAIWLMPGATARTYTNPAIYSDGSYVNLNCGGGAAFQFVELGANVIASLSRAIGCTWAASMVGPTIMQAPTAVAAATGAPFADYAQNATDATGIGGDRIVSSGTGGARPGTTRLQAGTVDGLRVGPGIRAGGTFTAIRTVDQRGAVRAPFRAIGAASYVIDTTPASPDYCVTLNTAAAGRACQLPLAADHPGREIVVVQLSGTFAVTVTSSGADTIDGAASDVFPVGSARQRHSYQSDGVSDWVRTA